LSAAEYIARLRSLVEGKEPIAVQTETPAALARLIVSVPQEKLSRPPAPGKWSLAAIVAHLAEAEIALSWRYRQIAEKEGAALSGYDQTCGAGLAITIPAICRNHLHSFAFFVKPTCGCLPGLLQTSGSVPACTPSVAA
jgi:hypothetical protein